MPAEPAFVAGTPAGRGPRGGRGYEMQKVLDRATRRAQKRLVEAHREEFRRLLADEYDRALAESAAP